MKTVSEIFKMSERLHERDTGSLPPYYGVNNFGTGRESPALQPLAPPRGGRASSPTVQQPFEELHRTRPSDHSTPQKPSRRMTCRAPLARGSAVHVEGARTEIRTKSGRIRAFTCFRAIFELTLNPRCRSPVPSGSYTCSALSHVLLKCMVMPCDAQTC